MNTLDLEPLKSAGASWQKKFTSKQFITFVVISGLVTLLILGIVFSRDGEASDIIFNVAAAFVSIMIIGAVILLALLAIASVFAGLRTNKAMKEFYSLNGKEEDPAFLKNFIPPVLRAAGRFANITHGGSIELEDRMIYLFNYVYTLDSENNRIEHTASVATFELTKEYPNIFLKGRKSSGENWYSSTQHISLEGRFDRSFELYAPLATKSLSLAVITPDLMQLLQDSTTDYDVEISGKNVSIISDASQFDYKTMKTILTAVSLLQKELFHKDLTWQPVVHEDRADALGRSRVTVFRLAFFSGILLLVIAILLLSR